MRFWNSAMRGQLLRVTMLVLGLSLLVGCESKEQRPEAEVKRQEQEINNIMSSLAARYGAISDWHQQLPHNSVSAAFTIQLSNLFVRPDHKPILFRALISDVVRDEGNYHLVFDQWSDSPSTLILDATGEQAERALKGKGRLFFDKYAIVAEIVRVERPQLAKGSDSEETDTFEGRLNERVILRGRCIDLVLLPSIREAPSRPSGDSFPY